MRAMSISEEQVSELAKLGFEAYGKSTGGLTWDGKPIPPWENVGEKVQAAWKAATKVIAETTADRAIPRG